MPSTPLHTALTRRERQIMDILYRRGRATAGEGMADLSGDPNYSTVRTQLRVLERKGYVRHEEAGLRDVYIPAVPRHAAPKAALRHLVDTFFGRSAGKIVGALLGGGGSRGAAARTKRIAGGGPDARRGRSNRLPAATRRTRVVGGLHRRECRAGSLVPGQPGQHVHSARRPAAPAVAGVGCERHRRRAMVDARRRAAPFVRDRIVGPPSPEQSFVSARDVGLEPTQD